MPPLLEGYRARILDGNHLAASEHRIEETRGTWAAPLPGKALVVLDPALMLVDEIILCEDGHAQERSLLDQVLSVVAPRDLWIADRNFCTNAFLTGIAGRGGSFVIRQHSQLRGTASGQRQSAGDVSTGEVYEQPFAIVDAENREFVLRRVTVELRRATRDGDREIHLLTNLPEPAAGAGKIAELYAERWTIETMFQELTETLTCEVKALGYPKAALFGFCLAVMAYHAVSVIKATLRAAFGRETVEREVSGYYLSLELTQTYDGMMIALPAPQWIEFRGLTPSELSEMLLEFAANVNLRRYKKHSRGPKKPPPPRTRCKNGGHVATAKLIAKRKSK